MLQIFLQQCAQLGVDIPAMWARFGDQYLHGMWNTIVLAVLATLIGCIIGFICGIISQDHDLEQMYLDSFLRLSRLEGNEGMIDDCVSQLENVSKLFHVDFVLSVSMDKEELSAGLQEKVILAL